MAQAPSAVTVPGQQTLLPAAIRALEGRASFSARLSAQIELFQQRLEGTGSYLEQHEGPIPLICMELQVGIGGQVTHLRQMCDGHFLWVHHKLLDDNTATLTQIDVRELVERIQQADPGRRPQAMALLAGLGGLSKLLRNVDDSFEFTTVQSGKLEQLPVWKLEGGWKRWRLLALLPKQKEAIEQGRPVNLSRLPEHVPDRIVLMIGQEDLFPRSIEYRRTLTEKERKGDGAEFRVLVAMQLRDVAFNVPIDRAKFAYNPGQPPTTNLTDAYLQALGLKRD
ncbi:MAG: hypothetical protein ABSG68_13705 [Thermoguttaceae bacterium]